MNLKDRMNYDANSSIRSEPVSAETLILQDLVNTLKKADRSSKKKKSIKNQEKTIAELQQRIRKLSDMNAELKELVDMSNVETVRSAIAAKYEAEKNARLQIDECRQNAASDISTAKADARSAIEESRKAVADIKKMVKNIKLMEGTVIRLNTVTAYKKLRYKQLQNTSLFHKL